MPDVKSGTLVKLPESANLSKQLVAEDGTLNVRAMAKTLGSLVTEVLSGDVQTSRAHTAIRGIRTMVALADAVRRSSDSPQSLLTVDSSRLLDAGIADVDG